MAHKGNDNTADYLYRNKLLSLGLFIPEAVRSTRTLMDRPGVSVPDTIDAGFVIDLIEFMTSMRTGSTRELLAVIHDTTMGSNNKSDQDNDTALLEVTRLVCLNKLFTAIKSNQMPPEVEPEDDPASIADSVMTC